jgi:hypothetical protein
MKESQKRAKEGNARNERMMIYYCILPAALIKT